MTQESESKDAIQALRDLRKTLSIAIDALSTHDLPVLNEPIDFYEEVRSFEIRLIQRALRETGGNQAQAARLLSLNQPTLHGKIKQYQIYPDLLLFRDCSGTGDTEP
jgi:DNA-binding protein Fis